MGEFAEKITPELKAEVEEQIASVRALVTGETPSEDAAAIRAAVESLTAALTKIGQQVYEQQQAESATAEEPAGEDACDAPPTEGGDDNDETVEGEYREV